MRDCSGGMILFTIWMALVVVMGIAVHASSGWSLSSCFVSSWSTHARDCCVSYGPRMMCLRWGTCYDSYWDVLVNHESLDEIWATTALEEHPVNSTSDCWTRSEWATSWDDPAGSFRTVTILLILLFVLPSIGIIGWCAWQSKRETRHLDYTNPFYQI